MALAVQVKQVVAVLLADGWHEGIEDFTVDSCEYRDGDRLIRAGNHGGLVAVAATWREGAQRLYCPVPSILALRCEDRSGPGSAQ